MGWGKSAAISKPADFWVPLSRSYINVLAFGATLEISYEDKEKEKRTFNQIFSQRLARAYEVRARVGA